ncbi:MAG: alpha/beta hydrolase family protein [Planctomycetaceae bacterium]
MQRRLALLLLLALSVPAFARKPAPETVRGDAMLADYFQRETTKIERSSLTDVKTLKDWQSRRKQARKRLFEMLSLDPLPKRTPLKPVVTGKVDHQDFTVEKLHFQSRPGLYVTGNLYVPKKRAGKLPAILYVCGHGRVKKGGISYGNKTHYQHHGAWFARNGYVCLTIDTLQLGEIEGIHHGTYNHGMWWWNARGYSPAGVEAWNCIRSLDYLQSRPEVDGERIGVTGRSGGGAYSWWIAALDERIKVAVPVAGITSLRNHVVDGCVEGHCDCMYPVNTYRWDFAEVASLVAPRPLLISNSDKDGIFPLEGVVDVYVKTRRIYNLYKKPGNLGLQITEGPHNDTQELRIHAFHWFNRHLKKDARYTRRKQPLIETAAVKFFQPEQLKVFDKLPSDEKNTKIHDTFIPLAKPVVPSGKAEWERMKAGWMKNLREKSFRGWPKTPDKLALKEAFSVERHGIRFAAYDFTSQRPFRLRLYVAHRAGLKPSELDLVVLNALDQKGWNEFLASMRVGFEGELKGESLPAADKAAFAQSQKMFRSFKWGMAYVAPRGVGPTEWNRDSRKRIQYRRRFMLLGQTRDGMRVYDVVRGAAALRNVRGFQHVALWMQGQRDMAGITLYASLFTKNVKRLDLWNLSRSHKTGPIFLNVLRFLDVPQAVAMAAVRSRVRLYQAEKTGWDFPREVVKRYVGKDALQVRVLSAKSR